MIDFSAHAECFAPVFRADWNNHKLLDIHIGSRCMRTAVEDIHHGNRHDIGCCAAKIAIERLSGCLRRSTGACQRDREHRICAKARLIRRRIQLNHGMIDAALVEDLLSREGLRYFRIDVADSLPNAFTAVALWVRIPQLARFIHAGGGSGGHRSPSKNSVFQFHIRLYRRVSARI